MPVVPRLVEGVFVRETTEAWKSSARGPIRKAKIRLDKGLAPLALGLASGSKLQSSARLQKGRR